MNCFVPKWPWLEYCVLYHTIDCWLMHNKWILNTQSLTGFDQMCCVFLFFFCRWHQTWLGCWETRKWTPSCVWPEDGPGETVPPKVQNEYYVYLNDHTVHNYTPVKTMSQANDVRGFRFLKKYQNINKKSNLCILTWM